MDAFTADYLANLTADLTTLLIPKAARRFKEAWQGDPMAQALQRCTYTAVLAMVSHASLDLPEEETLLADIFTHFFHNPDVATELMRLVRAQSLDVDELAFLFAEAGYDADTLSGLKFPTALAAFEAAFLEQAATEPALQKIMQVQQGWAQTALQREMVTLMRQMVADLQAQQGQTVGIQAGRIVADNVVSGTQIIQQQTVFQWGEGAASKGWEGNYLKTLIGRCNQLDLAEVDERVFVDGADEVQLTDVFTTLYAAHGAQIIMRTAGQTVAETLHPWRNNLMQYRQQADEAEEEKTPLTAVSAAGGLSRVVILGHPGGGKSTLVNYLATALAKQRLNPTTPSLPDWPETPLLPVRIILRRFAAWVVETVGNDVPAAKEGLLWDYLEQKLLPDWGCKENFAHLKQTLMSDGGVIFFDGLDEVPESIHEGRRTLIKEAITDFARPLDQCKIIVTCREYAYKQGDAWRLPTAQFPVIDLALFQDEQIQQFAQTWYQVMGPRLEWDAAKQAVEASRLANAVVSKPHLRELGQYPLLLTLMAQVHGRYGDLPENRADLYDSAINLLLSHWENRLVRQADGTQQIEPGLIAHLDLRREDVRTVLQAIAFAAHERQEGEDNRDSQAADIGRDELWEGLLPLVGSYDRAQTVTDYIQQRAGLLQAKEGFTYGFPHRTFQEYLAAAHVWSLPEEPVEALYIRLKRDTAWWREIFLLAAGQARADAYRVKSLVERLTPVPPQSDAVTEWQLTRAVLAAQTIHETNFMRFVRGKTEEHPFVLLVGCVRTWLETALTAEGSLAPPQRAAAGQALGGWVEDRRPGVGIDPETGLPDIIWGEVVPAGTYTIGGDPDAYRSFKEQTVQIDVPYRLAQYPITNRQFQTFIDAQDRQAPRWWQDIPASEQQFDYPAFPFDNHPRETVSWYQAIAFCRWLSAKLGYAVDLPHEYEWEVAAHYPDGRFYPWGNEFDENKANTRIGDRIGQTSTVGLYPSGKSEALNLYDLSGNVWEWCRNKFDQPEDNQLDASGAARVVRVVRGGSWDIAQYYPRAACRDFVNPVIRGFSIGFRVVVRRPLSHDH